MMFSVIIPVYNVEQYLRQCIESIVNQTFSDFEVLLIDDGSTDRSGDICDEYEANFSNITTYHKKNSGLSDTRNFGIDHALGEYLIFVDSDDWIELDSLQTFNDILRSKKLQILETTLVEVYENTYNSRESMKMERYLKTSQNKEDLLTWCLNVSKDNWPAQKKIVSREFIQKNNIKFLKGRLLEDLDWTSNVLYKVSTFDMTSKNWYYHRMDRSGSITNNIGIKNITDVIEMAASHYATLKKQYDTTHEKIFSRIMKSVYSSINLIKYCSKDDCLILSRCISNNLEIFEIAPCLKHKFFVYALKILGPALTIKILFEV